ncbi:MAG: hypothetical protein IPH93_12095 [Saprospiraceae bacterium]|nr:hypothetical protein [Saprospiraceae bacterium]
MNFPTSLEFKFFSIQHLTEYFMHSLPKSRVLELAKEAWIFHFELCAYSGQPEDRERQIHAPCESITVNAKENLFLTGEGVKVCAG